MDGRRRGVGPGTGSGLHAGSPARRSSAVAGCARTANPASPDRVPDVGRHGRRDPAGPALTGNRAVIDYCLITTDNIKIRPGGLIESSREHLFDAREKA